MLLTETQIQQALIQAKIAFPHFTDWEYNNEKNDEYPGFSMWGQFLFEPDNMMSKCFFVTIDTYQEKWRGYLTIGQHSYFWSSADAGDAYLLDTDDCDSLEDVILALKEEISKLVTAFSFIETTQL